jgi:hypothetical protein
MSIKHTNIVRFRLHKGVIVGLMRTLILFFISYNLFQKTFFQLLTDLIQDTRNNIYTFFRFYFYSLGDKTTMDLLHETDPQKCHKILLTNTSFTNIFNVQLPISFFSPITITPSLFNPFLIRTNYLFNSWKTDPQQILNIYQPHETLDQLLYIIDTSQNYTIKRVARVKARHYFSVHGEDYKDNYLSAQHETFEYLKQHTTHVELSDITLHYNFAKLFQQCEENPSKFFCFFFKNSQNMLLPTFVLTPEYLANHLTPFRTFFQTYQTIFPFIALFIHKTLSQ